MRMFYCFRFNQIHVQTQDRNEEPLDFEFQIRSEFIHHLKYVIFICFSSSILSKIIVFKEIIMNNILMYVFVYCLLLFHIV